MNSTRFFLIASLMTIALLAAAACGSGDNAETPKGDTTPAAERASLAGAPQGTPSDIVIPEWNASTFDKALNANGYTFIEFGGKSCKPCKQMQGILKELKSKHPALAIGNVYMENSRDLLNAWKVQLIPTQVILDRNRKEITRHVGLWELKDILAEFKKRNITL